MAKQKFKNLISGSLIKPEFKSKENLIYIDMIKLKDPSAIESRGNKDEQKIWWKEQILPAQVLHKASLMMSELWQYMLTREAEDKYN